MLEPSRNRAGTEQEPSRNRAGTEKSGWGIAGGRMMGRRGVGMRLRLVGTKGNNFSHFSLSYACFPLSYALKNHTKAKLICTIQRKAVSLHRSWYLGSTYLFSSVISRTWFFGTWTLLKDYSSTAYALTPRGVGFCAYIWIIQVVQDLRESNESKRKFTLFYLQVLYIH